MIDLLNQYLVQQRALAFPGIGFLQVSPASARYDASLQVLMPPRVSFQWKPAEDESYSLQPIIGFVSKHTQLTEEECYEAFLSWCSGVKRDLEKNGEWPWPGLGKLVMLAGGKTGFVPDAQLDAYTGILEATRATHTGRSHHIMVGDKETTTAAMQQQLQEEEWVEPGTGRWWIAALIVGMAGMGLIISRLAGWI